MANLIIKGGFTRIPNRFLEALICYRLSALKKDILLFLMRCTYGYQSKTAELSLTDLSSELKKTRPKVSKSLDELIDCKVIKVVKEFSSSHQPRTLAINMNPSLWLKGGCPDGKQLSKRATVSRPGNRSVSQMGNSTVIQKGNRKGHKPPANKGQNITPKKYLKKGKKKYSQNSVEFRLSFLLFSLLKKRRENFREPDMQEWGSHIDCLIRLDKQSPEEIERVIPWSLNNGFWQSKIISTKKLRKHYLSLAMQMNSEAEKNNSGVKKKQNVSESDRIRL